MRQREINYKELSKNIEKLPFGGDFWRTDVINYTKRLGGRRVDKPKLNYRFHVMVTPEKLFNELLLVCVEANMKKVEDGLKHELLISEEEKEISHPIEERRKK